ncbi:prephenate dehydratase [Pseudooceanicola sp. CBS1P-1]|uniref:prephenate dehydratase n=1 Tax=Pseudooceanicola albus TaxID=2692189 RepID=A0A6L7GAZ3_9RHOB|nr:MULTISPECIES: prephenate dehydratase [Pseudooceanicola]MBT9386392.1 prephenate dehydratase [Pseudooceanicola endophyticus]MXN20450.1 prephenate dehydratase [Pseudooceanicola albus]
MTRRIAFQGEPGAYSHQACVEARPGFEPLPCHSFEDAMQAVRDGVAELAMLPVDNSTFGRVADMHYLLPGSGLHIVGEAFVRVHINLLALPGTQLEEVKSATSHAMLLGQCRAFLSEHGIERITGSDTAGSALLISQQSDRSRAALASELAGEVYGLDVLARHIEDQANNTTRFLVMSRDLDTTRRGDHGMITTLIFETRNIPAALYKAMGGFATNGINMTKLESYMVGGSFEASQFYVDIEGHPEDDNVRLALDELRYFSNRMEILGVYPAGARRGNPGADSAS